jgi:hypothetical protein
MTADPWNFNTSELAREKEERQIDNAAEDGAWAEMGELAKAGCIWPDLANDEELERELALDRQCDIDQAADEARKRT